MKEHRRHAHELSDAVPCSLFQQKIDSLDTAAASLLIACTAAAVGLREPSDLGPLLSWILFCFSFSRLTSCGLCPLCRCFSLPSVPETRAANGQLLPSLHPNDVTASRWQLFDSRCNRLHVRCKTRERERDAAVASVNQCSQRR